MIEDLVSVIVPVYNVEEYLDACIGSITVQTYKNLEIILIDDGATDLSGEKCDKWKEKDERVRVIHQKNMGLSVARNVGIDKCNGLWITFIDSDDIVDENYVSHLYSLVQKYGTWIAQCEKNVLQDSLKRTENVKDSVFESNAFLLSYRYYTTAWGKLYKRELFEKERYPAGMIHEDMAITYKLVYMAKSIAYTNEILYLVRQREGSITRKEKFYKERLVVLRFYKEQIDFYKENNEIELVRKGYREYAYALLNHYAQTRNVLKDKEIAHKIKKEYQKISFKVIKNDSVISVKTRALLLVCFLFPEVWCYVIGRNGF